MQKGPIHKIYDMTEEAKAESLRTEADLIRYFTSAAKTTTNESVITPPGDDAAVLAPTPGMELINTVDVLIEGVDFSFAYARPDDVGYKSVMVNLSDIAAMRGRARWITIGLGLKRVEVDLVEGLTAGFLQACKEGNVALVGGDITSAPCLMLSVNVVGEVPPGRAVTRAGAKDGMLIAVTGPLGGSYAGYKLLTVKDRPNIRKRVLFTVRRAHLRPHARFDIVPALEKVEVGAMIDISDGFLVDLKHILTASGVGGEVNIPSIPILPEAVETAQAMGENAIKWALRGGEDFELILCLEEMEYEKLRCLFPAERCPIVVGRIKADHPGELRFLDERGKLVDYTEEGYDHFTPWEVV